MNEARNSTDRALNAADRSMEASIDYKRRLKRGTGVHVYHVEDSPRVFTCPECDVNFKVPEDMGVHLERHREVTHPVFKHDRRKGRVCRSKPCPKGCGRHFSAEGAKNAKMGQLKEHIPNCDGSRYLGAKGNGHSPNGKMKRRNRKPRIKEEK